MREQALVGFCIEMLPLRGQVTPSATFHEHVAAVRTRVLDALQHHRFPISQLIKSLKLVRDPKRPPLVTVVFNMDSGIALATGDDAAAVPPWWGLRLELAPSPVVHARFDQLWNVVESHDQIVVQCTYNTDLFDRDAVRSELRTFVDLLQVFTRTPGASVGSVSPELVTVA
jgi:non-ribosomal peptide synthetase component F